MVLAILEGVAREFPAVMRSALGAAANSEAKAVHCEGTDARRRRCMVLAAVAIFAKYSLGIALEKGEAIAKRQSTTRPLSLPSSAPPSHALPS